jgi:hypothetical protein
LYRLQRGVTDPEEAAKMATAAKAPPGVRYPAAVACAFNPEGTRLTVAYSDRSFFLWDTRDPAHVGRLRSFLAHSGGAVQVEFRWLIA